MGGLRWWDWSGGRDKGFGVVWHGQARHGRVRLGVSRQGLVRPDAARDLKGIYAIRHSDRNDHGAGGVA